MTHDELTRLLEIELAHLIEKGMDVPVARPMLNDDGEHYPGCRWDTPLPSTHHLIAMRPFLFDIRQIPATVLGYNLEVFTRWETKPEEFRLPPPEPDEEELEEEEPENEEDRIVLRLHPLDILLPPEKVIAYAEEHALEICEQLNDYTFSLKNICDMIVDYDFEEHKKRCEEIRLKRILG